MIPNNTFRLLPKRDSGRCDCIATFQQYINDTWVDYDEIKTIKISWFDNDADILPSSFEDKLKSFNNEAPGLTAPRFINLNASGIDTLLLPKSLYPVCNIYPAVGCVDVPQVTDINEGLLVDLSKYNNNVIIFFDAIKKYNLEDLNYDDTTKTILCDKRIIPLCLMRSVPNSSDFQVLYTHISSYIDDEYKLVLPDNYDYHPTDYIITLPDNLLTLNTKTNPTIKASIYIPMIEFNGIYGRLAFPKMQAYSTYTCYNAKYQAKYNYVWVPSWFQPVYSKYVIADSSTQSKNPILQSKAVQDIYTYALNCLLSNSLAPEANVEAFLFRLQDQIDDLRTRAMFRIIVNNIAERNALEDKTPMVWVVDASDDPTVDSGAASYMYNFDINQWIKITEAESLDMVVQWDNIVGIPNSSPALIDDAVLKRHAFGVDSHDMSWITGLQDALEEASKAGVEWMRAEDVEEVNGDKIIEDGKGYIFGNEHVVMKLPEDIQYGFTFDVLVLNTDHLYIINCNEIRINGYLVSSYDLDIEGRSTYMYIDDIYGFVNI